MFYMDETDVKAYWCDCGNRMKVSAAMRQMQQSANDQLESLGMPYEKLLAEELVFLLSQICIKICRMPNSGEQVRVGTAPITTRGARFIREFVLESPGGERLASAQSLWLLVNSVTRKILRPQAFPYELPYQESVIGGAIGDIVMPKPGHGEEVKSQLVEVCYSHLDCNNHVNNSVYGDFVCNCLPYEELLQKGLDKLAIRYHNEAKWGETLEIKTNGVNPGEYYIMGQKAGIPCFEALAEMKN